AHGLGEAVVGAARQADREFGVLDPLDRWGAVRQDLDVDPGGVHLGDAALADIVEAGRDGPAGAIAPGDVLLHLGIEIVLLEGDNLRFRRHRFLPDISGFEFYQAKVPVSWRSRPRNQSDP